MKIRFGGTDGACGMNVDIVSVVNEMIVYVVEEQGVSGVIVISSHVQALRGCDDRAIR